MAKPAECPICKEFGKGTMTEHSLCHDWYHCAGVVTVGAFSGNACGCPPCPTCGLASPDIVGYRTKENRYQSEEKGK